MKFNNSIISKFNSKRAINYLALLLVLFLSLNLSISCDTTEQQSKVKILLEAEDASCTEAWLNLKIESIALPIEITLFQGDSLLFTTNINSSDTTLFVENLLPNQNYSFYSTIEQFNNGTIKSNSITVTTMDTTSHNFTWETFTFGGANGSSYLKDVAIINENDIWAVGEIHTEDTDQFDSNGVWVQPYNAVHWNGTDWELKRIAWDGQVSRLTCVFAFNENDIWFGVTNFIHWDGTRFIQNYNPILQNNYIDKTVNAMWGESSNNFYAVGNEGKIMHYTNGCWTKIESGTEIRFVDINGKNGKIFCIASELFSDINSALYEIRDGIAILNDGTNLGTSSVSVYVLSNKLYVFGYYRLVKTVGKAEWREISEPVNFDGYSRIRGNGYNDIVVAGSFGKIDHFNGVNWSKRRITDKANNLVDFSSIAIKGNIVCAVGGVSIVTGRR